MARAISLPFASPLYRLVQIACALTPLQLNGPVAPTNRRIRGHTVHCRSFLTVRTNTGRSTWRTTGPVLTTLVPPFRKAPFGDGRYRKSGFGVVGRIVEQRETRTLPFLEIKDV